MPRFPGELQDLEMIRGAGRRWGFGNCIQYLKHAWAEQLHKEQGLSVEAAARGALMTEEEIREYVNGFRVLKPQGMTCEDAQKKSVDQFNNFLQSIDPTTCVHAETWGKCCPMQDS